MTARPIALTALVAMLACGVANFAVAEDAHFTKPVGQLQLTEGSLPAAALSDQNAWRRPQWQVAMRPYASLDGEGEIYVTPADDRAPNAIENSVDGPIDRAIESVGEGNAVATGPGPRLRVDIRAPAGRDVAGRLFFPGAADPSQHMVRFRIPAGEAREDARASLLWAKRTYYADLLQRNIAGAAWFRHQLRETSRQLGDPRRTAGAIRPSAASPATSAGMTWKAPLHS